jgi:hypothetical protein
VRGAKGNAIFGGVLALGAGAAWLGGAGEPSVPPTTAGLIALAALGPAAFLLGRLGGRARLVTALFLAALAAVAAQVVFRPGVPQSHDLQSHGWALYATWRSVLDGDPWPRWTPYLGLGAPLLQFYGPLPWVLCWPALALGAGPFGGLKSGLLLSQLVGAAATWAAARGLGASRPAALLAAVAMALAPYHLLDQSYRMAYAEAFALGLTPWTLAQAVRIARGEDRVLALAAGTGALVLSHPVTGLLLVPLAVPLLVVPLKRRPRRVLALLLAGGLGLGATAGFWLPMSVEQSATTLSKTAPVGKALGPLGAWPGELVTRQAWAGYDLRKKHPDEAGQRRAVPLYLGCVLLALAGAGLLAPRDEGEDASPDPRAWAVAGVLAVVLATKPTAALLELVPLYGRIQFPWRFLAPATGCFALAAALSLDRWTSPRLRPHLAALAVAALAFDAAPYLGAADWYGPYEGVVLRGPRDRLVPVDVPQGRFVRIENLRLPPSSFAWRVARTQGIFPEYDNPELRRRYVPGRPREGQSEAFGVSWRVLRRRIHPLVPGPLARLEGEPLVGVDVRFSGERVDVDVPPGSPGGRLAVASQAFPGWRVRVDGGAWRDAGAAEGLLAAPIPAGARRVEFRYSAWRPWDRAAGRLLTALTLLAIAVPPIRRRVAQIGRSTARPGGESLC